MSSREELSEGSMSETAVTPTKAQLRAAALLGPIGLFSLGTHLSVWGLTTEPFPESLVGGALFVGAFAAGVFAHEALHGVGHVLGGATWKEVEFGIHWGAMTPYAQCLVPTRAKNYRIAVGLPGVVLGIFPLTVGIGGGYWLCTVYAFLMLIAAAGDMVVLWVLRKECGETWVQDHPEKVGCLVLSRDQSTRPSPVQKMEVEDGKEGTEVSFRYLLLLSVISATLTAIGFMLAVEKLF